MLRRVSFIALCLGALFSTNAFSMNHTLIPGMLLTLEFRPGEAQTFNNVLFWSVKVKCTAHSANPVSNIYVDVLNKKAKVNGKMVKKGHPATIPIRDNDKLNIVAYAYAKVKLVNQSDKTIKANCSM